MRRLPLGLLVAGLALGGAGCAYYNGMYNANKFAREAAQSERAGRMDEARDRWRSAATHAESLTVRHPASRWVSDALLVEGRAFVHLGSYAEAVPVLAQAVQRARNGAQRSEALVLLGQARTSRSAGSRRPARRSMPHWRTARAAPAGEALLLRGRALARTRSERRGDRRLPRLERSPRGRATSPRSRSRRETRRAAGALYDSLSERGPYVEADWRSALGHLAAAGAEACAAALVDALAARRDLTPGERARLLLDDAARRLAAGDTAGAADRLGAVAVVAPDSVEAGPPAWGWRRSPSRRRATTRISRRRATGCSA